MIAHSEGGPLDPPTRQTQGQDLDLGQLLEHLPAGVVVYGHDTDIAFANREACRLLRLTCDLRTGAILRDPDLELIDEDQALVPPERHPARRMAATRAALAREVLGVRSRRTGETTWGLVDGYPELDGDMIRHIVVTFADITERRRAESSLREGAYFFRESQKLTSLGSYTLDIATGVWKASEELDAVFGIDKAYPHDIEGWVRLIHPEDAASMQRYFAEEVVGKGLPFHRDYRIVRFSDGQTRWVAGRGHVHRGPDGSPGTMIGTIQDITDRKEAESERELLQAQLQQAQKLESIGRLAGGVAHDFNNMLCVMTGRVEEALARLTPDHPSHGHLVQALKAAQRSSELTRQLLGFARRQTVAPRLIDLNQAVEGTIEMLRRLIGKDIEISWTPAPDLPALRVDPGQLDQILANLCVNARDAMGGRGRLAIGTFREVLQARDCAGQSDLAPGVFVGLSVRDSGSGMDPETLRQIFEPFFTTKETGKGTGLGLSTVYGIVKQNHGRIDVHSAPGAGTTFRILLPASEGMALGTAAPALRPPERGHETILLVEDEPLLLSMTTDILQSQGYDVIQTESAKDALDLFRTRANGIQLLVTDVVMPSMDGRELVERLRKNHPSLKVLFMSGYTSRIVGEETPLDEAANFVQKPFTMQSLLEKVRATLDG